MGQSGFITKNISGSGDIFLSLMEQDSSGIEFTGILSGNVNIIVGDDKAGYRWILKNTATGSYSLVFKTASGTGVSLFQGTNLVFADAVNIVREPDGGIINADDFGLAGDNTDESEKLNKLFAAAVGKCLVLGEQKIYRYNPSIGLNISGPISIISNGSKFRETIANTSYAINITGSDINIDAIVFEFIGSNNAQYTERGVRIVASNVKIGSLALLADLPQTGANDRLYNAVQIGPDIGSNSNIHIGEIRCVNWDRPVTIQNIRDWTIDFIDVSTYRRAVYIKDARFGQINGGDIRGMSPTSIGAPGENGILIEAVCADCTTENLRIKNVTVQDSGEHGFRIGGQHIVRDVWHENCVAKNTGLGAPENHGGCGFKVLGPTEIYGARHQGIHYVDCSVESCIYEQKVNFAGFQMGKVYGGTITNPIVRSAIPDAAYALPTTYSCFNGIEIIGCENITISNPQIDRPYNSGVYLYDFEEPGYDWGVMTDIVVNGGVIRNPLTAAVQVKALYKTFRRITITNLLCDGGQYALLSNLSAIGSFVGCSANMICWNQTSELIHDSKDWMFNGVGQWIGANECHTGSSFANWSSGQLMIREAPGWASPSTSFTFTLADGTAINWSPKRNNFWVFVSTGGAAYFGQAWVRTTADFASEKIAGGTNFAVTNTVLNGTTGIDTHLTLGVQENALYVENRTGVAQTITVTEL